MDFDRINQLNEQKREEAEKTQLLQTIKDTGDKVATAVVQTERNTKKVTVTNDLAKPSDIQKVVEAVNAIELNPQDLQPIADKLEMVGELIAKLPTEYPEFPSFPDAPEQREDVKVTNLSELKEYFESVVTAVGKLQTSVKFDPKIEVKPADVNITEKKVDLGPITKGLANLEKAFKAIKTPDFDTSKITSGLKGVQDSINGLSFPVPNYVLPFSKDGKATQVVLDAEGNIPTSVASETYSAVAVDASLAGDNLIVAITNTARLYYVSLSANGANSADVTAIVKIGTSEKFKVSLKAGSIFARNIGAGRRYLTGSSGDDIIVNLSDAQIVHVSVEYEDV